MRSRPAKTSTPSYIYRILSANAQRWPHNRPRAFQSEKGSFLFQLCHVLFLWPPTHVYPGFALGGWECQDSDGDRWIREVAVGPSQKPVVYMKHLAKQVSNAVGAAFFLFKEPKTNKAACQWTWDHTVYEHTGIKRSPHSLPRQTKVFSIISVWFALPWGLSTRAGCVREVHGQARIIVRFFSG